MGRAVRVVVLLSLVFACLAPASAQAAITGTAFMDYDSNGTNDVGGFVSGSSVKATDVGVGGVTVNAYDSSGTRVSTTTTAADGTYTVCSSGCAGTVRLEFSVPAGYQPSFKGTNNGTSVRFVAAASTGVDFAVTKPTQYCQDNPRLITCEFPFLTGNDATFGVFRVASSFGDSSARLSVDDAGDIPDMNVISGDPQPDIAQGTLVSPASGFGATWGIGIDRSANAFLGTYVKRHTQYGPSGGVNEIYRVNLTTGAASPFLRLGVATLPAHDLTIASGSPDWPALAVDGLRADANASDVYHLVGRAGLGDVDVSPDGSTLWAVEMTEAAPKLWRVPLNGSGDAVIAGTPVDYAIPLMPTTIDGISCEGKFHPMGMAVTDSRLVVGGVCGGETRTPLTVTNRALTSNVATITTSTPHGLSVGERVALAGVGSAFNNSGTYWIVTGTPTPTTFTFAKTNANVSSVASSGTVTRATATSAFVLEFDLSAHSFTSIAATTLNYPKASSNYFWQVYEPLTGVQDSGVWHDWSDSAPLVASGKLLTDDRSWPEPLLANVEIRSDGGIVLAFRDRYMDQASPNTVDYESASVSSWTQSHAYNGGADDLLLCRTGSGYEREYNAACPSTPSITGANPGGVLSSNSAAPNQGSGGTTTSAAVRAASSLFFWDGFAFTGAETLYSSEPSHPYTSQGGTTLMSGSNVMWSTAWDVSDLTQQGIKALGPCPAGGTADVADLCGPSGAADGAIVGGASLAAGKLPGPPCNGADCWGKGNGLSDLELLCDAAPVQIGNYVWIDANRNGIQDPGESIVSGVTVHLYDATNTLVGTAVTDANGQYFFSSNVNEVAAGNGDNSGGGLTTGATFTVRLDNPADYTGSGPMVPYTLTSATQTSTGTGSQSTSVDSNAAIVSSYPQVSVTALSAGQNNHTYDVGLVAPTTPVAVGDYVWVDANSNGLQDGGELPLQGVVVTLLNADGTPAHDINGQLVADATTDAAGYYLFDNLAAGSYKVQFTLPTGYTFTSTGGGTATNDSNPTPGVDPLVGTTPVFAVSGIASGQTVADSDSNTLATLVNPSIDAGVVPPAGGGSGGSGGGGTGGTGSGSGNETAGGSSVGGSGDASTSAGQQGTSGGSSLTGPGTNGRNSNGVSGGPGSTNPVPGANSGAVVGVGDLVWFDTNGNGTQDPTEKPMSGARVVILNADGTRARDAKGHVVPVQVTDVNGHYFFSNLQPGRYRMRFVYPQGYTSTAPGKGAKSAGSNAVAQKKRNQALTPVFTIAGTTNDETAKASMKKAKFANQSIDAGVIPPWAGVARGPSTVTG